MAHVGRRNRTNYWIKIRFREQHEIAIAGGSQVGPHRRRVARWSKWETRQVADGPIGALDLLETYRQRYPQAQVAVFYDGQRLSIEQVRHQAAERQRVIDGDE